MSEEKKTGLDLLRVPFPEHQISKLPKPTASKEVMDRLPKAKCNICGGYHQIEKIIHLDYVGHAALTDRLLDSDPMWSWEPLAFGGDGLPAFDSTGGLWIKLTVCGVTRIGYGNAKGNPYADVGSREKEVIGDALRNAAMRFGAALELWHKGQLHIDEDGPENKQIPESSKSIKQSEWDKLSADRKQYLSDLAMDFINEPDSEKSYDYYCQIRDGLDLIEEKAALKTLIPAELATKFNRIYKERSIKQEGV